MKYLLEVREHPDYGEKGLIIKSIGRDHFEPFNGQVIAHDIIEHPVKAHANCYVDEYLALGGTIAGRIENGYFTGYRYMELDDINSDIIQLAVGHFYSDGYIDLVLPCSYRLRDDDLEEQIRHSVKKGLSSVSTEIEEDYTFTEETVKYITAWICKGYGLFKKRFQGLQIYDISNHLFNEIKEKSDRFLKYAEVGSQANLYIVFNRYTCRLEEIYHDDDY